MRGTRLEAVTVCVGYGDFLAETAPRNRGLFDRWLIVTTPEDEETRWACFKWNLDVLLSQEGTRNGEFRKGWLVERGLQQLAADSWRLHLDADIAMPSFARWALEVADLDTECVYGCDRVMVRNWEAWRSLLGCGWLDTQRTYHYIHWPEGVTPGTRWASPSAGYVPIGYWQLWHGDADEWKGSRIRPYPRAHGNACRTDVQHTLQWDRRKRILIPELIVAHLESEQAERGANWSGRTTKRFGPAAAPLCGKHY